MRRSLWLLVLVGCGPMEELPEELEAEFDGIDCPRMEPEEGEDFDEPTPQPEAEPTRPFRSPFRFNTDDVEGSPLPDEQLADDHTAWPLLNRKPLGDVYFEEKLEPCQPAPACLERQAEALYSPDGNALIRFDGVAHVRSTPEDFANIVVIDLRRARVIELQTFGEFPPSFVLDGPRVAFCSGHLALECTVIDLEHDEVLMEFTTPNQPVLRGGKARFVFARTLVSTNDSTTNLEFPFEANFGSTTRLTLTGVPERVTNSETTGVITRTPMPNLTLPERLLTNVE